MAVSVNGESGKIQGFSKFGGSRAGIWWQIADLLRNAALLVALYFVYAFVRQVTADDWATANLNARRLIGFQDAIGLPSEADLQRSYFLGRPKIVRAANAFYMWGHFPVTTIFMIWVFLRHHHHFRVIRNSLMSLTFVGLILHLVFPLTPPRMFPTLGFVDTAARFGPNPYDLGAAEAANQIAAMPSLHVGWAVLVAISVIALSSTPLRFLALVHPILTTSVVVLTANHYWTDAIVAVFLVFASWMYSVRMANLSMFSLRDRSESDSPESLAEAHSFDVIDLDIVEASEATLPRRAHSDVR